MSHFRVRERGEWENVYESKKKRKDAGVKDSISQFVRALCKISVCGVSQKNGKQ